MTIKLFYNNPYITEFTTEVIQTKIIDNKYHLVLKETAFYPEGGGQPCDLGEIDGIKVEYVYEEDKIIYHVLNENVIKESIFCTVDFKRRFDHMQQHSGEHLLSSILLKLYNGKNVGFHLGTDYVTLDISITNLSKDMVKEVEAQVLYCRKKRFK
jgi:alanyl-tRNA synthetase